MIDLFSVGNKFGHRVSIQGSTLPDLFARSELDVFAPFSLSFGKALSTQSNILDSAQFINFQNKNHHTGKPRPYYILEYRPVPAFEISLFGEYDYNNDTDGIGLSGSDSIDIVFVFNDSDDQYKSNQH